MRISRVDVARREAFVTSLFQANPKTTIKEVQAALKVTDGKIMRPSRIAQLRDALKEPINVAPPATSEALTETSPVHEAAPDALVNVLPSAEAISDLKPLSYPRGPNAEPK